MNKKLIKTTSFGLCLLLIAACLLAFIPKTYANADEQEVYPQSFISDVEFTSLEDFAIGSSSYLFIDDGYLCYYVRGVSASASTYTKTTTEATSCDFIDGNYYYIDVNNITRSFPDNQEAPLITLGNYTGIVTDDYIYNFSDSKYYAWDGLVTAVEIENIDKLKIYSNTLYCISNGAVATVTGVTVTQNALGTLQYLNYGLTNTMPTLDLSEALKSSSVSFVEVRVGAYMTELDIEDLSGEYLSVGQTIISSGGTALLLATSGNASVILLGGETYICLTSVTSAYSQSFEQTASFTSAKVNILGGAVYSTTYASTATEVEVLAADTSVTVVSLCSSPSVFGGTFYKIRYTSGESEKEGYIPTAFLTEVEYIEDGDREVTDPDYRVDSLVQRVILLVAIILLILLAAIYLVHIGTRPKKKKKKVKSEDKLKEDNEM